jgi:hypothetical protein
MGHPGLVGLPLFIIIVFCFVLVLSNPRTHLSNAKPASGKTLSDKKGTGLTPDPKPKKKALSSNNKKASHAKVVPSSAGSSGLKVSSGSDGTYSKTGTLQPTGPGDSPQKSKQTDRPVPTIVNRAGHVLKKILY